MIAPLLWCLLAVPGLPGAVVIATPRGQTSVPITLERGGAAVAVPLLAQPLGLTVAIEGSRVARSEEHTSEFQSHSDLVCRLLLEKKKKETTTCIVPVLLPST